MPEPQQSDQQYIKLPDGSYGAFPSSMKDEEITAAIQKNYPTPPTGNAGTQQHPLVTPMPGESFADTMYRGVEMGKKVTPEQINTAKWEAIKDVPTVMSVASAPGLLTGLSEGISAGVPGLLKLGRGLIGAGVGAGIGERGGSALGGLFGETGKQVGGVTGSLAGGMLGGGLAAGLERRPATSLQSFRGQPGSIEPLPFGIQRLVPEALVPKGEMGSRTNPGWFNDIPSKVIDIPSKPELGSPENPGWVAKLPDRMPAKPTPQPELGSAENPGWMAKLPDRMPTREPALGSPENPGWLAKLPDRMPESTAPFGSPENPGWHSKIPSTMPKLLEPLMPEPELGSPQNPGWHSKIPSTMPKLLEPLMPEPELGSPQNPGWMAKIPTRMPTVRGETSLATRPQGIPELPGQGVRPAPTEQNITNIVRKRVVSPEEASRETQELGKEAARKPGEGLMDREARLLGTARARRSARGMKEPD